MIARIRKWLWLWRVRQWKRDNFHTRWLVLSAKIWQHLSEGEPTIQRYNQFSRNHRMLLNAMSNNIKLWRI